MSCDTDRTNAGVVRFNNDGFFNGSLDTGRFRNALDGEPSVNRFDAFSVALPEIGHALGVDSQPNTLWGSGNIVVVPIDRPAGSGTQGPTIQLFGDPNKGLHLSSGESVLPDNLSKGKRQTPPAVDNLAATPISDFANIDLAPMGHMLEPATVGLLILGCVFVKRRLVRRC